MNRSTTFTVFVDDDDKISPELKHKQELTQPISDDQSTTNTQITPPRTTTAISHKPIITPHHPLSTLRPLSHLPDVIIPLPRKHTLITNLNYSHSEDVHYINLLGSKVLGIPTTLSQNIRAETQFKNDIMNDNQIDIRMGNLANDIINDIQNHYHHGDGNVGIDDNHHDDHLIEVLNRYNRYKYNNLSYTSKLSPYNNNTNLFNKKTPILSTTSSYNDSNNHYTTNPHHKNFIPSPKQQLFNAIITDTNNDDYPLQLSKSLLSVNNYTRTISSSFIHFSPLLLPFPPQSLWDISTHCNNPECRVKYSKLTNKEHHCQGCGGSFCANCVKFKAYCVAAPLQHAFSGYDTKNSSYSNNNIKDNSIGHEDEEKYDDCDVELNNNTCNVGCDNTTTNNNSNNNTNSTKYKSYQNNSTKSHRSNNNTNVITYSMSKLALFLNKVRQTRNIASPIPNSKRHHHQNTSKAQPHISQQNSQSRQSRQNIEQGSKLTTFLNKFNSPSQTNLSEHQSSINTNTYRTNCSIHSTATAGMPTSNIFFSPTQPISTSTLLSQHSPYNTTDNDNSDTNNDLHTPHSHNNTQITNNNNALNQLVRKTLCSDCYNVILHSAQGKLLSDISYTNSYIPISARGSEIQGEIRFDLSTKQNSNDSSQNGSIIIDNNNLDDDDKMNAMINGENQYIFYRVQNQSNNNNNNNSHNNNDNNMNKNNTKNNNGQCKSNTNESKIDMSTTNSNKNSLLFPSNTLVLLTSESIHIDPIINPNLTTNSKPENNIQHNDSLHDTRTINEIHIANIDNGFSLISVINTTLKTVQTIESNTNKQPHRHHHINTIHSNSSNYSTTSQTSNTNNHISPIPIPPTTGIKKINHNYSRDEVYHMQTTIEKGIEALLGTPTLDTNDPLWEIALPSPESGILNVRFGIDYVNSNDDNNHPIAQNMNKMDNNVNHKDDDHNQNKNKNTQANSITNHNPNNRRESNSMHQYTGPDGRPLCLISPQLSSRTFRKPTKGSHVVANDCVIQHKNDNVGCITTNNDNNSNNTNNNNNALLTPNANNLAQSGMLNDSTPFLTNHHQLHTLPPHDIKLSNGTGNNNDIDFSINISNSLSSSSSSTFSQAAPIQEQQPPHPPITTIMNKRRSSLTLITPMSTITPSTDTIIASPRYCATVSIVNNSPNFFSQRRNTSNNTKQNGQSSNKSPTMRQTSKNNNNNDKNGQNSLSPRSLVSPKIVKHTKMYSIKRRNNSQLSMANNDNETTNTDIDVANVFKVNYTRNNNSSPKIKKWTTTSLLSPLPTTSWMFRKRRTEGSLKTSTSPNNHHKSPRKRVTWKLTSTTPKTNEHDINSTNYNNHIENPIVFQPNQNNNTTTTSVQQNLLSPINHSLLSPMNTKTTSRTINYHQYRKTKQTNKRQFDTNNINDNSSTPQHSQYSPEFEQILQRISEASGEDMCINDINALPNHTHNHQVENNDQDNDNNNINTKGTKDTKDVTVNTSNNMIPPVTKNNKLGPQYKFSPFLPKHNHNNDNSKINSTTSTKTVSTRQFKNVHPVSQDHRANDNQNKNSNENYP